MDSLHCQHPWSSNHLHGLGSRRNLLRIHTGFGSKTRFLNHGSQSLWLKILEILMLEFQIMFLSYFKPLMIFFSVFGLFDFWVSPYVDLRVTFLLPETIKLDVVAYLFDLEGLQAFQVKAWSFEESPGLPQSRNGGAMKKTFMKLVVLTVIVMISYFLVVDDVRNFFVPAQWTFGVQCTGCLDI